jgi:hypothetical protein
VEGDLTAIRAEIATFVGEALARFGTAGSVVANDNALILTGHGVDVSIELGRVPEDWRGMNEESRRRRALELARKLAERRRFNSSAPRASESAYSPWVLLFGLLVIGGLGFAVFHFVVRGNAEDLELVSPSLRGAAEPSAEPSVDDTRVRAREMCSRARARAAQGATLGPTDVEGWVVELGIVKLESERSLLNAAELDPFVTRKKPKNTGRFAWTGARRLVEIDAPSAVVRLSERSIGARGRLLTVTFAGAYVVPYFSQSDRGAYLDAAREIVTALAGDHAGLYARCEDDTRHYLGSWFYGNGNGHAVASLVYFMGVESERGVLSAPHLNAESWHVADGGVAAEADILATLSSAFEPLDRRRVATLLGPHGGMISGRDGAPSVVGFPFQDGNRASRASLAMARGMGVGATN